MRFPICSTSKWAYISHFRRLLCARGMPVPPRARPPAPVRICARHSDVRTRHGIFNLILIICKPPKKNKRMKPNTKPTSIRLSTKALALIQVFSSKHDYWTRSQIINSILESVLCDFDESSVYDLVRRPMFLNDPVSAHYKILNIPKIKKEE